MKNALIPLALACVLTLVIVGSSCTSFDTPSSQIPSLHISSMSMLTGRVGTPYGPVGLAADGGIRPYAWSIVSGKLPFGLAINSTNGAIVGTPTMAGEFSFTVGITDSSSPRRSAARTFSISISAASTPPLTITSPSVPNGQKGAPYSATLLASGGTQPYRWAIVSGWLPSGFSLDSANGVLSGTTASAGQSSFVLKVMDSSWPQQAATNQFSISISSAAPGSGQLVIATSFLPMGEAGNYYSSSLSALGGMQPYIWSISSGALPSGLSLNASTGMLSGTPASAGEFSFSAKVTDASSRKQTAVQALSVLVSGPSPLTATTSSLPTGRTSVAYSANITVSGGTQPYIWSVNSGALPSGLNLDTVNGALSGIPTAVGQYNFSVRIADSSSPLQTTIQALSISISASGPPPVTISPGQNIAAIVSSYPAGTTFAINPGVYRLQAPIQAKSRDVFLGPCSQPPCALSAQAVMNGSRLLTSFQRSGFYYYVADQRQQERVTIDSSQCQTGFEGCVYPEDLFFDDKPLTHVTSLAAVVSGSWFFDYAAHTIYFYDDPTGHKVETSVSYAAFAPGPANDVTVQGVTLEKFATPALMGALGGAGTGFGNPNTGVNWIIENNELRLNHSYGARVNFGWQVLNNYIHDNGNLGVGGGLGGGNTNGSGTLASNVLIQGNEIARNNYAHFLTGFQSGGSKITSSRGVVVRGNYVHDNDGPGLWTDVGNYGVVYENNTVADNTQGGIAHEISYGALVRNNRLLRNGDAMPSGSSWLYGANLLSSTSQGLEAYCNTIEVSTQGGNGINIIAQPRAAGENQVSSNNYYHHNTIVFDGESGITGGAWAPAYEQAYFQNNRFDFNSYYLPDVNRKAFIWNNNYDTFTQFQAAGEDVHGTAAALTAGGFPTVVIDSPTDQSAVAGVVNITGSASDTNSVSKVEFYVDWQLQSTVSGESFNFSWNTNAATAGHHIIAAMAYNSEGVRACYGITLNVQ